MIEALVCTVCLVCNTAIAQKNTKADSLFHLLAKTASDTARISLRGQLIDDYLKAGSIDSAKRIMKDMLASAGKTKNSVYTAKAFNYASLIYSTDRKLDSTLLYANKVFGLLKENRSSKATQLKIAANNNIAVAYSTAGKLEKSVNILIKNLKLIKEIQDKRLYHLTIHNISASFVMMSQDDKAYDYMLQDVALADTPGSDTRLQVLAYLNATVVCYNLKKFREQKHYLDKAEKALHQYGNSRRWPEFYAYQAMYYSGIKQPDSALIAAGNALEASEKYNDRQNEYLAYEAIRDANAAKKQYGKAKAAAQHIYRMGMEDGYIEAAIAATQNMSEFSSEMGDYEAAYHYSRRYNQLKDSIQFRQDAQKIKELETQLRTSQKEEKIARLESEKRNTSLHIKDQRLTNILLSAGCLFLLIVLGIVFILYRNNKRNMAQKEKIKMAEIMLNTQETERERIARDLHDGLVGTLSGIKMNLGVLARDPAKADINNGIVNAVHQLDSSIRELRHIAHNMMPEMLLRLGLETALKDLSHMLESAGIGVEQKFINLSQSIALDKQIMIYRIVQELFSNIIKHAHATSVFFQCAVQSSIFLITVEDDGVGLNQQAPEKSRGIGLANIESRVRYLNGSIDISSLDGEKGTSINIQLNV